MYLILTDGAFMSVDMMVCSGPGDMVTCCVMFVNHVHFHFCALPLVFLQERLLRVPVTEIMHRCNCFLLSHGWLADDLESVSALTAEL
jgi:hypothetical protein